MPIRHTPKEKKKQEIDIFKEKVRDSKKLTFKRKKN
jgi:hypothetical protein